MREKNIFTEKKIGASIYLIVGIDPGIKTAYSAIDLKGNHVKSGTLKEADADKIVSEIAKIGIPSIIASDVNPAPSFVLKIAARFNVRTFVPFKIMRSIEKREIGGKMENMHERDAFCGAIKCFRAYANRLRQIDSMNTELDREKLKHLIIQGFTLANAMLMFEKKDEVKSVNDNQPIVKKEKDSELIALALQNVNLRKALDAERARIEILENEIEKIGNSRYAERWKDNEMRKLLQENKKLSGMLRALKKRIGKK
ncbi:DUF460 domain-containing protein [Candidatus Micrarchaeota archaeon]|nr:DUF460 domain-containing protein [Candidatus Micrarchaeota archaeon]